ncbi:hypothetical protein TanjilG_26917 [Lupinus angustifolius]|uniref:Uncharacterized protein n=1 Tax=Lupinus angustifolius TaxID=3871 RepID=A0A4P1RIT8_LUPAN|nr:hypothetical protein TanjilG_26917 [Lupinus angustifolius]
MTKMNLSSKDILSVSSGNSSHFDTANRRIEMQERYSKILVECSSQLVIDEDVFQHKEGIKVFTSKVPMKASLFATMKNVNYLPNVLAVMEAEEKGAFASIWVDEAGYIAEGELHTIIQIEDRFLELAHPRGIAILCPGHLTISYMAALQKRLLQLATKLVDQGLLKGVTTKNLTVEEAKSAAEMMYVGSTLPVLPIVAWDVRPIGNGKVGELTMSLSDLIWDDMVAGPDSQRIHVTYVE